MADDLRDKIAEPRELVGRLVRQLWVEWAREQVAPKPSWLLPWEELDDGQREVDMRIGVALFEAGRGIGAKELAELERLHAERDEARAEARRHLEHLRIAHPDHFTPNVLGERLCGCGGQWPCPAPTTECPRCEGSRFEPGTEEEGDWDSAAMRHHPYTGEPCSACNGTGKATSADT